MAGQTFDDMYKVAVIIGILMKDNILFANSLGSDILSNGETITAFRPYFECTVILY
jgi:hypothetical protein